MPKKQTHGRECRKVFHRASHHVLMTDEMAAAEELKSTSHPATTRYLARSMYVFADWIPGSPSPFLSLLASQSRNATRVIRCGSGGGTLFLLSAVTHCGVWGWGRGSGGMCGWNIISMQPTNEPHALYRRHRRERQMGGGEAAKQVGRSVPRARLSTPRRAQPIHRSAECNMV